MFLTSRARLLCAREVAERWSVSTSLLWSWRDSEFGPPYFQFGRCVRYRVEDIERFEEFWYSAWPGTRV